MTINSGQLPVWFIGLGRWQAIMAAWLAGIVASLGLAPYDFLPAGFVAFPMLVWLLDGVWARNGSTERAVFPPFCLLRSAFVMGWAFGFGYFVGGLWWLGAALLVDGDAFLWALPFAVLGLPAVLAVYHGLAAALALCFWSTHLVRIIALALAFTLAEYARARLLTGFSWNEIGLLLTPNLLLQQSAAWLGLHGLTLWAVVMFSCPVLMFGKGESKTGAFAFSHRAAGVLLVTVLLAGHAGYGAYRLAQNPTVLDDDVDVRVVQPNIDQSQKWDPQEASRIFGLLLEMTGQREPGRADTQIIVWPESSFPFLIEENSGGISALSERLLPGETVLAGAARVVDDSQSGEPAYFNSILAVGQNGLVDGPFDKVHLVPFGEYLPFQSVLESLGLVQLVQMPGGFTAASERSRGQVADLPEFLPLICYEVIFQDEIQRTGSEKFILNVTNDAWYGNTPGPYQHARQATVTAVTLGLPLVRAANSGISLVNDAVGRKLIGLNLEKRGVITSKLPLPVAKTPFVLFGNLIVIVQFVALLLILLVANYKILRFHH
ncbi:apolipoprotein N-acyltransferase [Aureimonas fodinaquatilis]|uniref:Apolipoprotein N-acyltransferase n=1 Tax=Aureimonas fodinaquatilis TaxID=2565783 RepID=A0A5B0DRE7_9HYPH|nr:apolipoprotein N-acyltransferase [Aureimonas fodinaquatilis]KAA0968572.1 apolipoprotein N-acyltransferase [Aureimonas fodinaquatilis]